MVRKKAAPTKEELLARAVSEAIEQAHLPLSKIAEQCGVSRPTLYRMKRGEFMPQGHTLHKLAATLRVNAGALFEGRVERDPGTEAPADLTATVLAQDVRRIRARLQHFVSRSEFEKLALDVARLADATAAIAKTLESERQQRELKSQPSDTRKKAE